MENERDGIIGTMQFIGACRLIWTRNARPYG